MGMQRHKAAPLEILFPAQAAFFCNAEFKDCRCVKR